MVRLSMLIFIGSAMLIGGTARADGAPIDKAQRGVYAATVTDHHAATSEAKADAREQDKHNKPVRKAHKRHTKAGDRTRSAERRRGVGTTGVHDRMRFRGLDRNHDGIITRREWRGRGVSFRAHDWNRDGVLSGDEVRPGARVPVGFNRRFVEHDANNDGVISSAEWRGDAKRFHRLDTNHDGVVSRAEFGK